MICLSEFFLLISIWNNIWQDISNFRVYKNAKNCNNWMFNLFNELLKIIFKKVNEESLNTRRFCKQFKFGEFCLETNLLKNNQFLAKISKISIAAALKWKIYVIKTKLKTILDGSWTKKVNISIGARPRADTFPLRRPARSSHVLKFQWITRIHIEGHKYWQKYSGPQTFARKMTKTIF